MSDWRLMGQEAYLQSRHLVLQQWRPYRERWDHDHCAFCQRHISLPLATDDEDAVDRGYATDDGYHWICESCFRRLQGAVLLDHNRVLTAA
jgi:predicted RecB family nuclease